MPEEQDRRRRTSEPAQAPLELDTAARATPASTPASTPGRSSRTSRPVAPTEDDAATRMARAWGRHPVIAFLRHGRRVAFYRQLHALIRSGTGLPTALAEMARWAPDRRTRAALEAIGRDLQRGMGLAESMARHAGVFDDGIVELLVFAEETGQMETVLASSIDYLGRQQKLRWTAVFASLWPAYLLFAFVFVGPLFNVAGAISGKDATPGMAGAAYMSGLVSNLAIGFVALLAFFLLPLLLAALRLDAPWDRLKMSLPVVGSVVRAGHGARFFLALGLSISSGVEMIRGLGISLRASGSPALAARATVAQSRIRAGGTLADAIETLNVFPRPQLGQLAIAERTGTLDRSLQEIAADCQQTATNGTRILVVVMAFLAAVGIILLVMRPMMHTIFGPIWDYYHLADKIE